MIAVIHQPHFFPWPGYFNKLANANCFILQDDVQFRRRYFQNRTLIRSENASGARWLTLPVHAQRHTVIRNVGIADENWRKHITDCLLGSYRKAPFFSKFIGDITSHFAACTNSLLDINLKTIRFVLELLEIRLKIYCSSDFNAVGTPVEKLVSLCEQVGATDYVFGEGGGLAYHGASHFRHHGIAVHQQRYRAPYACFADSYYPPCRNLSILDLLFYLGPQDTSRVVRSYWQI